MKNGGRGRSRTSGVLPHGCLIYSQVPSPLGHPPTVPFGDNARIRTEELEFCGLLPSLLATLSFLERPGGVEPPTSALGKPRSVR